MGDQVEKVGVQNDIEGGNQSIRADESINEDNNVEGDQVEKENANKNKESCKCCGFSFNWWSNSFILDWAGVVVVAVLLVVVNTIDWLQKGDIMLANLEISHTLKEDKISIILAGVFIVVPCSVVAIFFAFKRRDNFEDLHAFALAVITGVVFSYLAWAVMGNSIAKLRPDFLARCAPKCLENITWTPAPDPEKYTADCGPVCAVQCNHDPRYPDDLECNFKQDGVEVLSVIDACKEFWHVTVEEAQLECQGNPGTGGYDEFSIKEGYRAMPSGHTLILFCCASSIWLYLLGKLQVYGAGVQQRTYCYGFVSASIMWVFATYVGMTRINDNKHSFLDVFIGALLGTLVSFFTYFLYFQDPRLGGEPLRRPNNVTICALLKCSNASLQKPWPAQNTHLGTEERDDLIPKKKETNNQDEGVELTTI